MLDNRPPQNKSICSVCIYYDNSKPLTCKAYPEGIIETILAGIKKHNRPIRGQVGKFVFTKIKEQN